MAVTFLRAPFLLLGVASMLLAACGGDGGGGSLASAPAPLLAPTPTPAPAASSAEPAMSTGTYGAIAVITGSDFETASFSQPGDIAIAVDRASNTYTLTVNQPLVAISSPMFHPRSPDGPSIPQQRVDTVLANGDRASNYLWLFLNPHTGPHYVSMAEWAYSLKHPAPDEREKEGAVAYFVFGQRTAPGDIPTSGTATYSSMMTDLTCDCYGGIRKLTADFAARTMAAELGLGGIYYLTNAAGAETEKEYSALLSGTGPITSLGAFDMRLSGTATIKVTGSGQSSTLGATGSLTGALFGPSAKEAGGAFSLTLPDNRIEFGSFTSVRD